MVVSSVAPLQPAGEIHGSSAEQHRHGTLSRTRTSMNRAMTTKSATEARKRLYALIDEVGQSHEPVQITGKRSNAVLLSPDDWRAIQETLHLGLDPRHA
jgi:prevent-host-death family protein